ncbi:MAG: hypothetical protein QOC81_2925 [Thermoanaerobaculia bacterium]|jgi:hypothetical protein|nr:hypothetical protein [Thermoanaerobaculia bacterium]
MHCSCETPGEVLVLPREGGASQFSNERYEIAYSARSILRHYAEMRDERGIPEETWDCLDRFPSQPFVLRVREGEEHRTALKLSTDKRVRAAIPNVAITPATTLSNREIDRAIERHHAQAGAPVCGSGVRVAVLDTGIDPAIVSTCATQYDIVSPAASMRPHDPDGHGSVVSAIIQRIAPAASILSVKVFPNGTLGGLIIGLQIAMAAFQPHVINLSLGLDAVRDRCKNCGYPNGQQFPEALIHAFFKSLAHNWMTIRPLIVAAAGNDSRLLLPARCDSILAVGAYDETARDRPAYARYSRVPAGRFVLADGGDSARPFGQTGWGKALFGTSFSAAIASGVAARLACAYVGHNPCGMGNPPPNGAFDIALLHDIHQSADRLANHNSQIHGLGVLRYGR